MSDEYSPILPFGSEVPTVHAQYSLSQTQPQPKRLSSDEDPLLQQLSEQQRLWADEDSAYSWVIAVCGGLTVFATIGFINTFGVFTDALQKEFGVDSFAISLPPSIANLLVPLIGLLAGGVGDRYGPRWLYVASALCMVGAMFVCAFAHSFWLLSVAYGILMGAAAGLAYTPSLGLVAQWMQRYRSIGMGLVFMEANVGGSLLPLLASYLDDTYGWRKAFQYFSLLPLLLLVAAVLTRQRTGPKVDSKNATDEEDPTNEGSSEGALIPLLSKAVTYLLWVMGFCQAYGFFTPIVHINEYALKQGLDKGQADLALSVLGGAIAVGNLVWGVVGTLLAPLTLLRLSYVLSAVCLGAWPLCKSVTTVLAFAGAAGFCSGGFLTMFTTVVTLNYDSHHSTAIALVFTGWGVGSLVGPVLSGALKDWTAAYMVPAECGAGSFALALILTFLLSLVGKRA
eukprot:NODE_785_length_1907_cov_19.590958_g725_i0.p1 GENE.NODE_785_length_1907_cov_19.590958_g725_i0~~NODE_785_length_1907_cov_19.590958_g725_i0.p1  ORF type:complete len:495 (+),score=81.65 NODE_785_length_1907_cov_19.590958_g725_i0:124-1485(+)